MDWSRPRRSMLLVSLCLALAGPHLVEMASVSEEVVEANFNLQLLQPRFIGNEVHRNEKPYTKFDSWLTKLLKKIDIKDVERKRYVSAYKALEKDLLLALKEEDALFRIVFSKVHPTGSSFEGLRIDNPNEFDMNAILNLPVGNKEDIKVKEVEFAGHVVLHSLKPIESYYDEPWFTNHIKQKGEEGNLNIIRKSLQKWWIGDYLSRGRVLQWMQSAMDRALDKMGKQRYLDVWRVIKTISRRLSGPAVTLEVCMVNGAHFSVDFVPALLFRVEDLPNVMKNQVKVIAKTTRGWYLIPKGPQESAGKVWRASLWDHERDYTNGLQHFKPLVRLLKKLRDEQNWSGLASYYVKTAVMLIAETTQDGGQEYFKSSIGILIMRGLKQLETLTMACKLPFFWDKGHNLLERMSKDTSFNISKRLAVIIKSFEKSLTDDQEDPMKFFGTTKNETTSILNASTTRGNTSSNASTMSGRKQCTVQ